MADSDNVDKKFTVKPPTTLAGGQVTIIRISSDSMTDKDIAMVSSLIDAKCNTSTDPKAPQVTVARAMTPKLPTHIAVNIPKDMNADDVYSSILEVIDGLNERNAQIETKVPPVSYNYSVNPCSLASNSQSACYLG